MDLSGYSDDQLKAMLDAPPAVVAPVQAAPAAPAAAPDLSHLSDDQLQAMLPAGDAKPLTVHGTPIDHGATASGMAGFLDGIPVVGPKLLDLSADTGAAIATLRDGGTYADQRAKIQQNLDATRAAHPYAGTAGSIAGGVVGTAPLVAAAPGAFGVGGGSLALRSLAGAGSSAVLGGADSAARSDQQGAGRVVDAAKGALIGGAVGGVAPLAGAALGAGYRRLMGQAVQDTAELPATVRQDFVKKLYQDAPLDPVGKLRQFGDAGMLADAGPSLEGVAMGQAAKDGLGAAVVLDALENRHAGTSGRILGDVAGAIGPAQNADAVARQIADVGQASTQPYFQRAYQAGVPQGADLDALAQRPAVAAAMRDAATNAANRGAPLPTVILDDAGRQVGAQAPLNVANAATRPAVDNAIGALLGNRGGTIGTAASIMQQRAEQAAPLYDAARSAVIPPEAMPVDLLKRLQTAGAFGDAQRTLAIQGRPIDIANVEPWDLMKRSLDDRIGAAQRAGENHAASVYQGLKNELTGALDEAVPEYAQARQSFAGQSDLLSALRQGQQAAGTGVTREQVAGDFAQLGTDGEREMYRLGLGNAWREKLAAAGDNANFADRVAGNQQLRDKLATVAPSQEALNAFNQHMATARQTFTEAQRPTPDAWHHALNVLDEKAAKGDTGAAAARDALERRLSQDPAFARGRQLQADYGNPLLQGSGALPEALNAGRTALRGGPNAIHPEDYALTIQGRSPAAQAAQRAGLNSEIYRQLGEHPNDVIPLKGITKEESDRSRAILASTFGQDAADRLAGTSARERAFQETRGNVLKGSMTARRTEAVAGQKAAEPDPFQIGPTGGLTMTGIGATIAKKPINALLRALQPAADTTGHDLAYAKLITATGAERNRMLAQILRAQAQEDANARLGQNAARVGTSLTALSPSVLAAALRGHRQSSIPAR